MKIGSEDKNAEDDNEQGLLYTDWKCLATSSVASRISAKRILSATCWIEIEIVFIQEALRFKTCFKLLLIPISYQL